MTKFTRNRNLNYAKMPKDLLPGTTSNIDGFILHQTCSACPEQYDVYKNKRRVGYLRLRHGFFTAEFPWCGGECVYEAEPNGDGRFDENERDFHLKLAIEAIKQKLNAS